METQDKRQTSQWTLVVRVLVATVAFVFLIWSLLPLSRRIFNAGVMASVPVFTILIALSVFWPKAKAAVKVLWAKKGWHIVLKIFAVILATLLSLFVVVSACMLTAAAKTPPKQATVIVLGAGLNGESPSLMLAQRLDAAAHYLEKNEESVCIVSGGQGPDEVCPEAEVMYRYLVAKGIDASRIYQENRSTNTNENIRFSYEIIQSKGLNDKVVIATQEFHQFRAQSMARRAGIQAVGACTCRSPWYLLECYWVREFAGVCHFWLLGY